MESIGYNGSMRTITGINSGLTFKLDGDEITFVHGKNCEGCDASLGVCRELTNTFRGLTIDEDTIEQHYTDGGLRD